LFYGFIASIKVRISPPKGKSSCQKTSGAIEKPAKIFELNRPEAFTGEATNQQDNPAAFTLGEIAKAFEGRSLSDIVRPEAGPDTGDSASFDSPQEEP
jgi:hypothetical protein